MTEPRYTAVAILTDKEETGSDGNTGLNSSYFKYFVSDLADCFGANYHTVLSNTKCLSADVNAAFDPSFPDVSEKMNASYLNHGVVITKYTGARVRAVQAMPLRNIWVKSEHCSMKTT